MCRLHYVIDKEDVKKYTGLHFLRRFLIKYFNLIIFDKYFVFFKYWRLLLNVSVTLFLAWGCS